MLIFANLNSDILGIKLIMKDRYSWKKTDADHIYQYMGGKIDI